MSKNLNDAFMELYAARTGSINDRRYKHLRDEYGLTGSLSDSEHEMLGLFKGSNSDRWAKYLKVLGGTSKAELLPSTFYGTGEDPVSDWILRSGYWDDDGVWVDDDVWEDGP